MPLVLAGCGIATSAAIGGQALDTTSGTHAFQGKANVGIGESDDDPPTEAHNSTQHFLRTELSVGSPGKHDANAFQGSVLFGFERLSFGYDAGWQVSAYAGPWSLASNTSAIVRVGGGPMWFVRTHTDPRSHAFVATSLALELTIGATPDPGDLVFGVALMLRHDSIEPRFKPVELPPLFE